MSKAASAENGVVSLAIGLFGSVWVVAIHGLVDAPLATPRVYALVFIAFGVAAAASSHLVRRARRRVVVETPGDGDMSESS
jgi:heme A synthase